MVFRDQRQLGFFGHPNAAKVSQGQEKTIVDVFNMRKNRSSCDASLNNGVLQLHVRTTLSPSPTYTCSRLTRGPLQVFGLVLGNLCCFQAFPLLTTSVSSGATWRSQSSAPDSAIFYACDKVHGNCEHWRRLRRCFLLCFDEIWDHFY